MDGKRRVPRDRWLEKRQQEKAESALAEQIMRCLNEKNSLEVPSSLVEQQRKMLEQEIALQARVRGAFWTPSQMNSLQATLEEDAKNRVKAGLLMAAIARKNELTVTNDDLEKAYAEIANESGKNLARVKGEFPR